LGVYTENTASGTARQVISATGSTEAVHSNTAIQPELQVGPYKDMSEANAGNGNSADHIPSYMSLVTAEEARLDRPLNAVEKKAIKENGLTLMVNTRDHQTTSQTYGGRNTRARQLQDAAHPIQAVQNNVNAYRQTLLNNGYTNEQINQAIQRLIVPFQPANLQSSGNSNTSNSTNH
jgi:hypothetical protein